MTAEVRRPHLSIVAVLALSFTSLTVLAVAGALWLGLRNASSSTEALLRERAANALDLTVERLLGHVDPVLQQAQGIAEMVRAGRLDPGDARALGLVLAGAVAATPQVGSIGLLQPDCRLDLYRRGDAAPSRRESAGACATLDWARRADGVRWATPRWDPVLRQSVVAIEQPLHGPGGFAGLLISSVALADLSRFLARISDGTGQTPFILYGRDAVVAHAAQPPTEGLLSAGHPLLDLAQTGDPVLAQLWIPGAEPVSAAEMVPNSQGHRLALSGGAVTVMYRMLDAGTDERWIVGTYYRGTMAEAEQARLRMTALMGAILLVLTLLLTLAVGRWLSRPIRRLALAAAGIEREDLDGFVPLPSSTVREFDQAATAFNGMVLGLRERRHIRDLFGRYVPGDVVDELLADPSAIRVGGERRPVSLLFSDIAGFTTLAEQLPADQVVALLNAYFEQVSRLVAEHGGIVVDFIGDAVFALFGAPIAHADHTARAIRCARALTRWTAEFAEERQACGIALGQTRIGVHTGLAAIGNFGSDERLKYGAAGDPVNIAARIESANKLFGTQLLASADIVAAAGDGPSRPIGHLVLKGRSSAIEVHELLDEAPDWLTAYEAAYLLLEAGAPAALPAFRALAAQRPEDRVIAIHLGHAEAGRFSTILELAEK